MQVVRPFNSCESLLIFQPFHRFIDLLLLLHKLLQVERVYLIIFGLQSTAHFA